MVEALERRSKDADAARNVSASFVGQLDSGELLTGTPTVTEYTEDADGVLTTSSDLTISDIAVNTAALTINGKTVAVGQAVQFKVSGGTADTNYVLRITAATDATPAQTLILDCPLSVD